MDYKYHTRPSVFAFHSCSFFFISNELLGKAEERGITLGLQMPCNSDKITLGCVFDFKYPCVPANICHERTVFTVNIAEFGTAVPCAHI